MYQHTRLAKMPVVKNNSNEMEFNDLNIGDYYLVYPKGNLTWNNLKCIKVIYKSTGDLFNSLIHLSWVDDNTTTWSRIADISENFRVYLDISKDMKLINRKPKLDNILDKT